MQEEGRAGVEEDTCQDRYPSKRNKVYRKVEPQRQTRQRNDDEHLQTEEQNRRSTAQVMRTEDIQINHKQTQEKNHQYRLAENRERALFGA